MLSNSSYAAKQIQDQQMAQLQCYQTIHMQTNTQTTSKYHNHNAVYSTVYTQLNKLTSIKRHNHTVIKHFIWSQINTRPASNLWTTNTRPAKAIAQCIKHIQKTHDNQIVTIAIQSTVCTAKHTPTSGKCHNHNVIKQFLWSQTKTWPENFTITMLSNRLYATIDAHLWQVS